MHENQGRSRFDRFDFYMVRYLSHQIQVVSRIGCVSDQRETSEHLFQPSSWIATLTPSPGELDGEDGEDSIRAPRPGAPGLAGLGTWENTDDRDRDEVVASGLRAGEKKKAARAEPAKKWDDWEEFDEDPAGGRRDAAGPGGRGRGGRDAAGPSGRGRARFDAEDDLQLPDLDDGLDEDDEDLPDDYLPLDFGGPAYAPLEAWEAGGEAATRRQPRGRAAAPRREASPGARGGLSPKGRGRGDAAAPKGRGRGDEGPRDSRPPPGREGAPRRPQEGAPRRPQSPAKGVPGGPAGGISYGGGANAGMTRRIRQ